MLLTQCKPSESVLITEIGQVTGIAKPRLCYGYEVTINDDQTFIVRMNVQDLSKLRWKWVEYTYSNQPVCITQKAIISIHERQ